VLSLRWPNSKLLPMREFSITQEQLIQIIQIARPDENAVATIQALELFDPNQVGANLRAIAQEGFERQQLALRQERLEREAERALRDEQERIRREAERALRNEQERLQREAERAQREEEMFLRIRQAQIATEQNIERQARLRRLERSNNYIERIYDSQREMFDFQQQIQLLTMEKDRVDQLRMRGLDSQVNRDASGRLNRQIQDLERQLRMAQ
jgi:hypothetical protein